jgi:hypothetical protein
MVGSGSGVDDLKRPSVNGAPLQSVTRRSWFLCSKCKNPSRARGWLREGSFIEEKGLPVLPGVGREAEKRAQWAQVESTGQERAFLFQVPLKPTLPHGRAGPGGSHPIMSEWGRSMVVPSQVMVVWAIPRQPT